MIVRLKAISLAILFFYSAVVVAGNVGEVSTSVHLQWNTSNQQLDFDKAVFPTAFLGLPVYSYVFNANQNTSAEVQLLKVSYQPYQGQPLSKEQLKLIRNQPLIEQQTGIDRKSNKITISMLPIVNINGQLQLVTSFDWSIIPISSSFSERQSNGNARMYASNSLLSAGKWFKFGVPQEGVYKLDYVFLKKLGLSVDAINPANIRIFGQRAGMLPELAGADREDDIREIPIKVISATGNTFGVNDYVLAFLPGPEKWTYNSAKQLFVAQKHLYSDTKNFFITTDAGTGARIPSVNSSPLPETKTITTYNDYAFIEEDKTNIAQSGRQFVGDDFGGITNRTYSFNFPNMLSTQPAKLNIAVVGKSNTFGSTFTVSTDNGANSNSIFISTVPVNAGIEDAAVRVERQIPLNSLNSNFNLSLNFNRNGDYNTKGWLDFLQVNVVSNLQYNNQPLAFRNIASVGSGAVSKFVLQNVNPNVEIWDVTNPFAIQKINYSLSGNTASFTIATDTLKQFIAVENSSNIPIPFGSIANQNLHAMPQKDLLIVTRNAYLSQAQEIAQFHQNKDNMSVAVVDVNQIFNEFSSGNNDITAVRDFVKMFYDRAGGNTNIMPKYLLLLGDGSYDNKNLGDYLLPTYESYKTYETLETYVSDDYFGILDDNEGADITNTATELMDVAVGRISADDVQKAQIAVAKIKSYSANSAFGDWRNQGAFIADDEDNNIHEIDADTVANRYINAQKKSNIDKIYLDAYQQQPGINGATYPAVNDAINRKLFTGTLFLNYVGHGGPMGWAKERVLTFDDINQWTNADKLPLFITATCEFAPYDHPDENSAGERVLFKDGGGGIALVATTRLVYSNRNKLMNLNFMQSMTDAYAIENMKLGDIVRVAKNVTNTGDGNRKFTLLGDPAIRLAFPKYNVVATTINNKLFSSPHDTLKALSSITIEGEVRDNSNVLMPSFNGIASVIIYDKAKQVYTLVNDPTSSNNPNGSAPFAFTLQKNTIYRGKVLVNNGKFKVSFLVPKDIDYNLGNGKLSLYANSDTTDAAGYTTDIVIGGAKDTLITDTKGPDVNLFMNDDKFAFGGITDESPKIYCKLYAKNGINTSGNGVGHDITAILDNDTRKVYNLNDFYETSVNDITHGTVLYPLSKLAKGRHTLEVKAWDVLNNSGAGYTEFLVEERANIALYHVLNYPNPFTTSTRFMFEHNKPGVALDVKIEIFSVSGKIVKTILKNINTIGYRVDDITWDGLDDYGDKIGKGVYIYRVTLKEESGKKISQYQKLVLLN